MEAFTLFDILINKIGQLVNFKALLTPSPVYHFQELQQLVTRLENLVPVVNELMSSVDERLVPSLDRLTSSMVSSVDQSLVPSVLELKSSMENQLVDSVNQLMSSVDEKLVPSLDGLMSSMDKLVTSVAPNNAGKNSLE